MPASANIKREAIAEGEEGEEEEEGGEEGGSGAADATAAPVIRTPRRIGRLAGDESDCTSDGSVSEDEGFS